MIQQQTTFIAICHLRKIQNSNYLVVHIWSKREIVDEDDAEKRKIISNVNDSVIILEQNLSRLHSIIKSSLKMVKNATY